MFILRKSPTKGTAIEKQLGSHYNLIDENHNPEQFKDCIEQLGTVTDTTYAFISNGRRILSLCSTQTNHIINEDGKKVKDVSKGAYKKPK